MFKYILKSIELYILSIELYILFIEIYMLSSWNHIAHMILQLTLFTYQHVLESFICWGEHLHLILLATAEHMLWISHCFPATSLLMYISTFFQFFHWNQCCNNHSEPTSLWMNTGHFSRQITRTEMESLGHRASISFTLTDTAGGYPFLPSFMMLHLSLDCNHSIPIVTIYQVFIEC